MSNRDDGDDLYQDCLVTAFTKFNHLRDRTAFRPWLYRIIVNTFKDHVRRPWWKRIVSLTPETAAAIPGTNPGARYTARRRLEIAFRAISAEDRVMITLFELEGWSVADLARLLGKTEAAVKVRMSRARRKMRKALTGFLASAEGKLIVESLEKDRICVAPKPGEN